MRRARALLLNVLLAAASLAVTAFVLEGGARLLRLRTPFFLHPVRATCERRSRILSLEFIPSCEGTLADTVFRTNLLGLRGDEVRNDGSLRILALGDSCTWGWRVAQNESYPAGLEQALARRPGGARYQVINAGVPGYTSWQGVVYLRERGLALGPAVVLVGFGFNELFQTGDIEKRLASQERWFPFLRLDDALLDRSTLYRWLRWNVEQAVQPDLGPQGTPEQYGRNLRTTIDLARGGGARVLLVNFLRPGPSHQQYNAALATVAHDTDVPVVQYDGPRFDVVHPTAAGYETLTAALVARLETVGYLR